MPRRDLGVAFANTLDKGLSVQGFAFSQVSLDVVYAAVTEKRTVNQIVPSSYASYSVFERNYGITLTEAAVDCMDRGGLLATFLQQEDMDRLASTLSDYTW